MNYELDSISVVVLAGGINRISLYEGYSAGYKSLMPLEGRPLIQFVLDALGGVPQVRRTCIVGPEEIRKGIENPTRYEYAPEGTTLGESITNGLRHFVDSPIVMLIPADLPLVTPASIIDFLKRCRQIETPYETSLFWSMIPEKSFTGNFKKVTKGYNRFRDVSVCHGNLALMTPSILQNKKMTSRIDEVYDARKSSIKAALKVGLFIGVGYFVGVHLLRLMTLSRSAVKLSRYLGMGIIPVLLEYPEVAVDIDNSDDYLFVLEQIARQKT